MKSIIAVFVIALTIVLPINAYAACPSINGPYFCCGGYQWYQYIWTTNCAGTSGSVSGSTLSCGSAPAFAFTGWSGTVTYSYTIGVSDPIVNSNHWSAGLVVDFNDPNNSQYNSITATVSVTHSGSTTSYTIFSWNGTRGDLSCSQRNYFFFTAVAGDTITVTITGTNFNSGNTTIKAGEPWLFNEP